MPNDKPERKPLPAMPADFRIAELPASLGARYSALKVIGGQMHSLGDAAVKTERSATSRREQRRLQSVNRLARAAATAVEATIWLGGAIDKDAVRRGVSADRREAILMQLAQDGILLTDDLVYDAALIAAYRSEPTRSRK